MTFQFLFTVCGGGFLVAGLITGFSCGWDMASDDNKARIALIMVIFGAIFFLLGILIMIFLYKVVTSASSEKNPEDSPETEEHSGAQISESDRL